MMDRLPVSERLLVVEETLRKIRVEDTSGSASIKENEGENFPHPILRLSGIWSDKIADDFRSILAEGDKVDLDEW